MTECSVINHGVEQWTRGYKQRKRSSSQAVLYEMSWCPLLVRTRHYKVGGHATINFLAVNYV